MLKLSLEMKNDAGDKAEQIPRVRKIHMAPCGVGVVTDLLRDIIITSVCSDLIGGNLCSLGPNLLNKLMQINSKQFSNLNT